MARRDRLIHLDWICEQWDRMAAIIYWQANEINTVVNNIKPEDDLDTSLLKHISPISWDNIIFYGEYVLNSNLVRV